LLQTLQRALLRTARSVLESQRQGLRMLVMTRTTAMLTTMAL